MADVITGSGGWSKGQRWRFVAVLIAIVVLAAAVGAAVRLTTSKPDAPVKTTPRTLPTVVNDVQDLRVGGKFEQAQKLIDTALANPSTSKEVRYLLYIQEGSMQTDMGKAADAIPFYKQAAAIKETYEITLLLGDTYLQIGDKTNALVWYKKALPLVPKEGNPLYNDDKKTLEDKIKSVEAEG